ncbi:Neutral and basic amino acid transport protein rBAT [Araneus ventricosus]|uniref:alpha-glucosidase n=1 Tax=Araneus ventricosus TaxID=182803 RepID=A0A4Y2VDF3_ARAVE|nr:Neutral and basic amino acid transport protein rBAT [Araneus ventricosus]
MVVPINIPVTTDTKLFNNAKPVVRNTNVVLKKKVRPVVSSERRACLILSLITFTAMCVFATVLYFNPFSYEPWYKTATLYQVDVKTFQDSDGDGIGDLKGLISKVDYLERQNIKALILSSFYKSENDGIIDHKDVCYTCGVMDDFRELIKQLKKRGIRLIIDFYPNHTSDKHPWFEASIKGLKSYDGYYVWSYSVSDDERKPPNNWVKIYHFVI